MRARRPSLCFLHSIKAWRHEPTSDADAATNLPYRYGLNLIVAGHYWEAHEVLEAVWLAAAPNSRERYLVQGLIHVANAALKRQNGQSRAAARIVQRAHDSLTSAFAGDLERLMGLEREDLFACLEQLLTDEAASGVATPETPLLSFYSQFSGAVNRTQPSTVIANRNMRKKK